MQKSYPRLQHIDLPKANKLKAGLGKTIKQRSSFRDFSNKPIDTQVLSDVLYYSAGAFRKNPLDNENSLRAYPSAGAKFPLEVYPLILKGKDIEEGLYHYDPSNHSLEILLQPVSPQETGPIWTSQDWFRKAAAIIILTAVFERTTQKYGERGIKFPYIESGHLAQNIYLTATSIDLGCCAIGLLNEKPIIKLLDIIPEDEYPIYYVALGN